MLQRITNRLGWGKKRLTGLLEDMKPTWSMYFGSPDEWLSKAKDIHKGERCFLLGMGPSLNKTDLTLLKNEYTFGVNGIYMVENFTPVYYAMISSAFWKTHVEGVKNVRCQRRFIPMDTKGELDSHVPTSWINFQRPTRRQWGKVIPEPWYFSQKPHRVIQGGGTVLFICLQLAYYMGFNQAIILGVDHDYHQPKDFVDGSMVTVTSNTDTGHFRRDYHPTGTSYQVDLQAMERGYVLAKKMFEKDGREILNASPGTKLETYPLVDYESLFSAP